MKTVSPSSRRALLGALLAAPAASMLPRPLRAQQPSTTLLNVSYDVAREVYKEINPAFVRFWKDKTGETVAVNQSHAGSSAQAMAVVNGLAADIVTMNQATDIDLIAQRGGLLPTDWRGRLPHDSAPYTSTMVFMVRKGNPKGIRDWDDLVKPGMQVVIPNPKVTGNGRYGYLAAWGWVLSRGGTEAQAREFVAKLFANVPVLDSGGRAASTTFVQRGIGDALVTFENEVQLIDREGGGDQVDPVYPSASILAEAPVAVVDKVVERKGTRRVAQAYAEFLFSPEAQEIFARANFRPRDEAVLKRHAAKFPAIKLFTIDQHFGSWANAQKTHFADGGAFDQILGPARR